MSMKRAMKKEQKIKKGGQRRTVNGYEKKRR